MNDLLGGFEILVKVCVGIKALADGIEGIQRLQSVFTKLLRRPSVKRSRRTKRKAHADRSQPAMRKPLAKPGKTRRGGRTVKL